MRKKKGDCWFLIEADGNAGMHRVKLAGNYKGAIIKYLGGRRGLVNFGGGLPFFGLPFREG